MGVVNQEIFESLNEDSKITKDNYVDFAKTSNFCLSVKLRYNGEELFSSETVEVPLGISQKQLTKIKIIKMLNMKKELVKMFHFSGSIDKDTYEDDIQLLNNKLEQLG